MKKYALIFFVSILFLSLTGTAYAEEVNNYFSGAFAKTFPESGFNGDLKDMVVKVVVEVDNDIYKKRKDNALLALDTYQALEDAFLSRGWQLIDYYTNKPETGRLFITFDPRMRSVVIFTEMEIKDFESKTKNREDNINRYFKDIVEEVESRLKEQYRLK